MTINQISERELIEHSIPTIKNNSNEENYSSVFANIEEGVALHEMVFDDQGNPIDFIWLDMNPTYERITQLKKEDTIGKRGLDIIPNIEKRWIEAYGNVVKSGESIMLTDHSAYLDKYWDVKAFCYDRPNQFAIAMMDVTEQVKTQKALAESEEKYRRIIESLPLGVHTYTLESDGKLIFTGHNGSAQKMLDADLSPMVGKTIEQAFPGLADTEIPKLYREVATTGNPWNSQQIDYDFNQITGAFEVNAFRSSQGKIAVLFSDITEQLKAQVILEESEMKTRLLLENLESGIGYFDINGNVIHFNKKAASNLGGKPEEFAGKNLIELFGQEKGKIYIARFNDVIRSKTCIEYEDKVFLPEGNRWFLSNYIRIQDASKTVIGVQVISTDITNHKTNELSLLEAKSKAEEADMLKSAFLANMSHEIRTPMNGILGFADLLKEPDLSGEEQQKYLEIIKFSGERMLTTVNDIIDISKIDSNQVEISLNEIDIHDEINSLFSFFLPETKQKGLDFRYDNKLLGDNQVFVNDKVKINSIMTNLIKNAIKYTLKGSIEIACSIRNEYLHFYVKDTGIGIPKNRLESVFNRFEQIEHSDTFARQGSGLGLSITKSYVEMLGGKIWVESIENLGSTFYVELPWKG